MIDYKVDRDARIDCLRIAAGFRHRVAQRGEIDHHRHAQHILQQHARRPERDLDAAFAARQCGQHAGRHFRRIGMAQQIFSKDAQRKRQLREARQCGLLFGCAQAGITKLHACYVEFLQCDSVR